MVLQYLEEKDVFSDRIKGIIGNHKTISFIGLEKGCGKTSAFKTFLSAQGGCVTGVSSIGTDHSVKFGNSENKRLVYVQQDTLVATARQALSLCDPTKQILEATGIETPMGEVVIFRALSDGYVSLAGPSILAESIEIKQKLLEGGADKVMLDGAVNRRSPALPQLSDGVVFTARLVNDQCENVYEKIVHEVETLTIKALDDRALADLCQQQSLYAETNYIVDENLNVHYPQSEEARNMVPFITQYEGEIRAVGFKGALTDARLAPLLEADSSVLSRIQEVPLIIEDPTKCFIDSLSRNVLLSKGLSLNVINPVDLLALCINPENAGLDHSQLKDIMMDLSRLFGIPVLDVVGVLYVE